MMRTSESTRPAPPPKPYWFWIAHGTIVVTARIAVRWATGRAKASVTIPASAEQAERHERLHGDDRAEHHRRGACARHDRALRDADCGSRHAA